MADVTVIVPTFNRYDLCCRAVESALHQTMVCDVMVANDGEPMYGPWGPYVRCIETGRKDHWYLTVYDAVYRARTPYVTILCDDDWLAPTFIEECHRSLTTNGDGVAFAFSNACIVHADGRRESHWHDLKGGIWLSDNLGRAMLCDRRILTPSVCLYRRDDVLRRLVPGGVPGFPSAMPGCANPSGPDHLLPLLLLLDYPQVAYVSDCLAYLDAGPQSTTIQELTGPTRGADLAANYDAARALYATLLARKGASAKP